MNPERLQVVQDAEVISEKHAGTTNCPLMMETERLEKENNDPSASWDKASTWRYERRMCKFSLCLSHTLAVNAGDVRLNPKHKLYLRTTHQPLNRRDHLFMPQNHIQSKTVLTHNCTVQKHSLLMCENSHTGKYGINGDFTVVPNHAKLTVTMLGCLYGWQGSCTQLLKCSEWYEICYKWINQYISKTAKKDI